MLGSGQQASRVGLRVSVGHVVGPAAQQGFDRIAVEPIGMRAGEVGHRCEGDGATDGRRVRGGQRPPHRELAAG